MNVKIVNKKDNPLVKRLEAEFRVEHEGKPTPPKSEVTDVLAAKLNSKPDLMILKHYTTPFGTNVSRGFCWVYESQQAMEQAEAQKVLRPEKRVGKTKKAPEKDQKTQKKPQAKTEDAKEAKKSKDEKKEKAEKADKEKAEKKKAKPKKVEEDQDSEEDKEAKEKIVKYLEGRKTTATTEQVAKQTDLKQKDAQAYLKELREDGEIKKDDWKPKQEKGDK